MEKANVTGEDLDSARASYGEAAADPASSDFNVARSEENVLQWMSYLPQDCIESMIRMGWDFTT